MIAVFWPYDGWINIGPVAEEIREPQRNVPLALGLGMLIVIARLCRREHRLSPLLPMDTIRRLRRSGHRCLSKVLWARYGVPLAAAGVMISMFGALNSNLLCGPRIYFAMARDRLFPARHPPGSRAFQDAGQRDPGSDRLVAGADSLRMPGRPLRRKPNRSARIRARTPATPGDAFDA